MAYIENQVQYSAVSVIQDVLILFSSNEHERYKKVQRSVQSVYGRVGCLRQLDGDKRASEVVEVMAGEYHRLYGSCRVMSRTISFNDSILRVCLDCVYMIRLPKGDHPNYMWD